MVKAALDVVKKICSQSKRHHHIPDFDKTSTSSSSKKLRRDPLGSHDFQNTHSFEPNLRSRNYYNNIIIINPLEDNKVIMLFLFQRKTIQILFLIPKRKQTYLVQIGFQIQSLFDNISNIELFD